MPHINTKPTALWIEDEGHQVSAWKSHLASAFSFATEDPVEDEVSARETLKKMSDRVDLLITDLKIRSGPNQTFPPDLGTAHAWGLELVQRSAEMWPKIGRAHV